MQNGAIGTRPTMAKVEANEKNTTHTVVFSCRHTLTFKNPAPKKADTLWCLRCEEYREIIDAPANYRVRCFDCRMSRSFGRNRVNAMSLAVNHRKRKPTHTTVLYDGRKVEITFDGRSENAEEPLF